MTCKASIIISLVLMVTGTSLAQKMGTFKDVRDGRTYLSVTLHDQVWMAENLSFRSGTNSEGCWAYLNNQQNAEVYGYLYSYETAQK
ncbi:MAG: FISUMP domain-containing protein, partial [Bacteroidota bacterium]